MSDELYPSLTLNVVPKVTWTLETMHGELIFNLIKKPPLWFRVGLWVWFGLRGKEVEK